ncbi:hypothetical protein JCM10213_004872 [Rhodosporidiobolus nylandii]
MLFATRTAALQAARAPAASRSIATSAARQATNPATSTPAQGHVKETAWTDRRVQAKSTAPLWPWFALLSTFGGAVAYKWFVADADRTAEYRNGTLPPSEIGSTGKAGESAKPPTFAEKK